MIKQLMQSLDLKPTPLVLYGVLAIAVIFTVLGLERLASASNALETRVIEEQTNLAILEQLQETDVWPERLQYSLSARERAKTAIWSGATSGVIAAKFQQGLQQAALAQKTTNIRIRVDPEPTEVDGLDVLAFDFTGFVPAGDGIIELFATIADQPQLILIRDVNFVHSIRDRRPTRLTFSGFLPIQIDAAEPVTP